jgi:hypothetical protein
MSLRAPFVRKPRARDKGSFKKFENLLPNACVRREKEGGRTYYYDASKTATTTPLIGNCARCTVLD